MGADPIAREELRALKLQVVPVTVVDSQVIIGFNRPALVKALGLGQTKIAAELQGPRWMLGKFETVLGGARRATAQIPDTLIDWTSPERGRNLRQFTFHLFDRPNLMLNGYETRIFRAEDRGRYIGEALERRDVADIVAFGDEVVQRIRSFFNTASQETLDTVIDTYMGPLTLQQLLDLGLGHSVHHLKQLYVFMEQIGIPPARPLSQSDFDGVAVPTELF
ncbi:MAG: DinB family protein [Chloroflexi bacterium]|nr:DinB family protein [Chloroflexota bacterium]